MGASIGSVLQGAHKALDTANKFQHSVTGGKEDLAAKSDAHPAASSYSHVRATRKSPGEFMGVSSDQAGDINAALATREANKKALESN